VDAAVREAFLVKVAEVRAALYDVAGNQSLSLRVHRLCDALSAWRSLPEPGARHYASVVLEVLFGLIADIEEDEELSGTERMTVELSLWDVAAELHLVDHASARAVFISKRRSRLSESLRKSAATDVERLLYKWASLLQSRPGPVRNLPGPFREDAEAVIDTLLTAGLPRRAKALAGKFQIPVAPLVRWTIEHRPPSEEEDRTKKLIQRLALPPRPVSFGALVAGRALQRVLSASLDAIPMTVGSSGAITIDRQPYGALSRR